MHATHATGSSRGFTLVEVLVTLLVLSIGLLGIAKLLLVSSRANDSAYMRTQATALAYSLRWPVPACSSTLPHMA
jgi:type IV pilus assembly protein PilV